MQTKKRKSPSLRFRGYTDDWEERKLSNVVSLLGGNAFKSKDSVTEEGVRWLKIANVSNSGIKWNEESFLPSDYWERYPNYRIVAGDYVMALTRPIIAHELKIAKMPLGSNALLNQRVAKLIWNMNADFGFQLLRKRNVVDYIEQTISGTDPPNLSGNTFEKIMVSVPETVEQEKIGRFLETVDNLLAANQHKLDLLKEQKKGYLQKMFPKNGEKVPELRFAGFADDWEERKLKELGDIQTGNTPPTSDSDNYSLDGVLWVTPTDIKSLVISNTAKKLSQVGVTKARIAKAGSILVTSIASIGKNTLLRMDAGFNQQINSLTPTSENDSYFLLTQSEKWSEKMKQTAASATMQIVNKTDFSNISTYVPVHKEEQEKIGSFFKQLDDTIDLHQRKLDLLKEQKKGFLQKMFV